MTHKQRLNDLGSVIPENTFWGGIVSCKQVGDLVYISGRGPNEADGSLNLVATIGWDLTVEQGYQAARKVSLNLLARLRAHLGNLDRVSDIVKVVG